MAGRYVSCDAEEDDSARKSTTGLTTSDETGKEPKPSTNENVPSKSPKPSSTSTALTQISNTKLPTDKNIDNSHDKSSASNFTPPTKTGNKALSADDSPLQSSPSSEEIVSTSPKQKEMKDSSVSKESKESQKGKK